MFDNLRRHLAVWREAWGAENRRPKSARSKHEREFLPAAIEIMETPASPIGRTIMLLIAAFFVIALIWAYFGQIDVVAVAQGQIIPQSRVKVVQPSELGVVRAIHVKEGSRVKKGDVLIGLDPTDSSADRDRISRELLTARVDIARLEALLHPEKPALKAFDPPAGASVEMIETQRGLIVSSYEEYRARIRVQDNEYARQKAAHGVVSTVIDKLDNTIPLIQETVDKRQYLADQGYWPKLNLLELKRELIEAEKDRVTQVSRLKEIEAVLGGISRQRDQIKQEYRHGLLTELAEAENRAAALEQEFRKAEKRAALQDLLAPVDGVVKQLAVHTVGAVVKPADPLMVIVPEGENLEVEAMVLNKDIGFVHEGQAAEVKLETFPFTKYGVIHGEVMKISPDAVTDERLGLVYPARVSLSESTMTVDQKVVNLTTGMATTVEIKTGTRKVIEFLLTPLLRYRGESLRER